MRGHSRSCHPTFVILALLLSLVACGGGGPATTSAASTAPLRIVLGWAGDAATERAVTWRTVVAVTNPQAQIAEAAPTGDGARVAPKAVPAVARTIRIGHGRVVTHYLAAFTGLRPATRYVYRVGDGVSFSAWYRFKTASSDTSPFRFIYLGDAQNGLSDRWPPVARAAFAAAPDAAFVVHAGDLVSEGDDDSQWGAWLAGLGEKATEVPNIPVPGNHDLYRSPLVDPSGDVLAPVPLWNAHFALPANGPSELADLAGQNYYVDYQCARIVGIDVNAFANADFAPSRRAQVREALVKWLRRVIGANPRRWTIVVQHQPMYSVEKGRDYVEMRAALGPIYDKYRVDLVLQGHDHAYARTHKVHDGRLADPDAPGTIYAVSVSGKKMYGIATDRGSLMAAVRQGTQSFQVVSVSPERLSYESRAKDGTLVDAFDLVKAAGGQTSSYVNRTPGATTAGRARTAPPISAGLVR